MNSHTHTYSLTHTHTHTHTHTQPHTHTHMIRDTRAKRCTLWALPVSTHRFLTRFAAASRGMLVSNRRWTCACECEGVYMQCVESTVKQHKRHQ